MEDRLLKLAGLVDAGSFTKGAAALHMSQPALSTAIQKLERELKAELIVRGGRSLRLTDAGQLAYQAAKDLAVHNANLRQHISELTNQQSDIRIGMIDSLADILIGEQAVLAELQTQAHIALTVDNSRRLLQALAHDQLDIAFVAQPTAHIAGIDHSHHLGNEPLLLVAHPAQTARLTTALLAHTLPHFLGYNQESTTHQLIQRAFEQQGIRALPKFYSTSPDILLKLALAQQGTAVLPYQMVANHLQQHTLAYITDMPVIPRPVVAAVRKGKQRSVALALLCDRMHKLLQAQYRQTADWSQPGR